MNKTVILMQLKLGGLLTLNENHGFFDEFFEV